MKAMDALVRASGERVRRERKELARRLRRTADVLRRGVDLMPCGGHGEDWIEAAEAEVAYLERTFRNEEA